MAVMERARTRRRVVNPTSGGGGGNNLGAWKGFGDDDGSYGKSHNEIQGLRGAFTGVIEEFKKDVGVDPFKKQLISSAQAGKATAFAETKAPRYVENAQKFYCAAKTASDSDLKIKKEQIKFAKDHSTNLVNQQEQDHELARHQMNNVVATATMKWETTEVFLEAQGSIEQLSRQTMAL